VDWPDVVNPTRRNASLGAGVDPGPGLRIKRLVDGLFQPVDAHGIAGFEAGDRGLFRFFRIAGLDAQVDLADVADELAPSEADRATDQRLVVPGRWMLPQITSIMNEVGGGIIC
jgi:hypothetical protein